MAEQRIVQLKSTFLKNIFIVFIYLLLSLCTACLVLTEQVWNIKYLSNTSLTLWSIINMTPVSSAPVVFTHKNKTNKNANPSEHLLGCDRTCQIPGGDTVEWTWLWPARSRTQDLWGYPEVSGSCESSGMWGGAPLDQTCSSTFDGRSVELCSGQYGGQIDTLSPLSCSVSWAAFGSVTHVKLCPHNCQDSRAVWEDDLRNQTVLNGLLDYFKNRSLTLRWK